jgi:hypothetical protein
LFDRRTLPDFSCIRSELIGFKLPSTDFVSLGGL